MFYLVVFDQPGIYNRIQIRVWNRSGEIIWNVPTNTCLSTEQTHTNKLLSLPEPLFIELHVL